MSMGRFGRVGLAQANHWQDWGNLVLAGWLFISPWILQFDAAAGGAAWNAWIFGVIIAIVAIAAIVQLAPWEEWVLLILGLWLFVAPWVLGFSNSGAAAWDHWIVGVLAFVLAAWNLSMTSDTVAVDPAHAGDRPRQDL